MIRPFTILTFMTAFGSGLYLYQSKHEVQVLDRTIERSVHETTALRDQSRLLAAEWTMLNDPERLRQFSDEYLRLKTIVPAQFTSYAELDNRLPPIITEPSTPDAQPQIPISLGTPLQQEAETASASHNEQPLPLPPVPSSAHETVLVSESRTPGRPAIVDVAARQVIGDVSRVTDPSPRAQAGTKSSDARAGEPKTAEPRQPTRKEPAIRPVILGEKQAEPRRLAAELAQRPVVMGDARPAQPMAPSAEPRSPAPPVHPVSVATVKPLPAPAWQPQTAPAPVPVPYRVPVTTAPALTSAPYGGSLLGIARNAMPAAPRPTPVSTTTFN